MIYHDIDMDRNNRVFILCGDYGITNSFNKIFDRIWMNAIGGHSFGIEKKENNQDKDGKNVGGFDGDGWAKVDWQILLSNEDDVFESGDWKGLSLKVIDKKIKGKGDHLLIIRGSRDGIESLQNIFDNAREELKKEDKEFGFIKLFSDDDENLHLGSIYADDGGDGFGFYVILEDNNVFDNPIELSKKMGMEVEFYRR